MTKPSTQNQADQSQVAHDEFSDTLSAAGELSDAQLERVAAGTSAQCQAPSISNVKNSRN